MIENSPDNKTNKTNFWDSAVGTITKITTLVTALSGLIFAISKLPIFPHSDSNPDKADTAQHIIEPKAKPYTEVSVPGTFPQASQRLLISEDCNNLSKADLKIMRNEIYARHGYIFQTQDMRSYFQNKKWYMDLPKYSNVNFLLTGLENANIKLIKRYESQ